MDLHIYLAYASTDMVLSNNSNKLCLTWSLNEMFDVGQNAAEIQNKEVFTALVVAASCQGSE